MSIQPTHKGSRLFALDLARLMAMLMMMQGHTLDALVNPQLMDLGTFPWNIWQFMRGLTAPIFLIVSGTVHVFAMKRDEQGAQEKGECIGHGSSCCGVICLYFLQID